jgi:hypothetical protein
VTSTPLYGSLPLEIGLQDKLVNLTIFGYNLTRELPKEMENLTSLKILNISNNVFIGNFPGKITVGMTELEVLDTYNNNFSRPLSMEFASLKNLKHLCLGGNFFSGPIPESYSKIQSPEFFGLNGDALMGKVPASLGQLKNLIGEIPEIFSRLTNISLINLYRNNLHGPVPSFVGDLPNLEVL